MLGDLPRNAWHIQGFPCKDVFVATEEVNERAFLFGGKCGTNAYHFTLKATRIYEDPLGGLYRFERPGRFLRIGRFFGDLLLEGGEFPGGNDCRGMLAALNLARRRCQRR